MYKKYYLSFSIILNIVALKANGALPVYPSEVLGRDLRIPGASWVGHVGIATGAPMGTEATKVIEVLNERAAIKVNSIQDFKLRSNYWGSRYMGATTPSIDPRHVIWNAFYQKSECAEYSMDASFTPGTIDNTGKPLQCAKFRCDTFVNYVYHAAGYDLPTYTGRLPTLPLTVFRAFPWGNGDGPYAYNNNRQIMPVTQKQKKIEKITPANVIAVLEAQGNNDLDKDTMKEFWVLAQNTDLETEKRLYLIDYLGTQGAVDLIPEFINTYFKEENIEIKSKLLRSTQGLYQKHIKDDEHSKEKTILKEFYATLLNDHLPTQDSDIVLRGIIRLYSTQFVEEHADRIRTVINNPEIETPSIINVGHYLDLIRKSKKLEELFLPELIHELKNRHDSEADSFLYDQIVWLLGNVGIHTLEKSSKSLIASYLESNQPNDLNYFPNNSLWLEATALAHSNSYKEAGKWIADFLISKSLTEQADYINWFSKTNYMKEVLKTEPFFKHFIKMANQSLEHSQYNSIKYTQEQLKRGLAPDAKAHLKNAAIQDAVDRINAKG
jgi:hypothetical protein